MQSGATAIWRRRNALLAVSGGFFASALTGLAQFSYTADFSDTTAPGWVLNPDGNSDPAAILTSGAAPRLGDPEYGNTVIDSSGQGWLRLTNDTNNTHNAVYFDTPIPSAGNAVTVNFGMNLWGGNNLAGTGADGLTFFLYDASKDFIVGANGGSLGYAQKSGTGGDDHDGMNGGWVGVSFDAYGNFSVETEGRQGGTGSLQPNSVSVRGPGSGTDGYDYLAGTGNRDYTDTGDATVLDAGDGTVPELPYTMAYPTATDRPNQSTQYRNVEITFDENSQLLVSMQFGEDGLWYEVLNIDLSTFVRPEQLKMGFSAGTGGGTLVAEIGGLLSVTATAGSGNFVWDGDIAGDGSGNPNYNAATWGTAAGDPLNWAGNTNPTLKANVLFNSSFVTNAQNIDVTGSDKVIKNMYFGGSHAYTLSTSDERRLIFDSDSIGVPTSINLTNDMGGNASHTIALDVQMNRNLEINNNLGAANPFTVSGNVDTNGNSLALKGVGTTVLSGVVSGTGTLTKYDSGTTVLGGAGANTYSGLTTINGGTLQVEKNTALGSTAAGTLVNAGTLALHGTGLSIAEGLTLHGTGSAAQGALLNATGTNTWTGTVALGSSTSIGTASGTTLTVSGVVAGADASSLTKAGTGTLVLAGTNTYTGATNLTAGTLVISNEHNLGGSPSAFNAAQLNIDGGTLRTTTGTVTINDANRGVTVGAAGGIFDTTSDLVIANAVAGTGTLTKTGAGTLTLSGNNSHSGAVAITSGTLTASGGNAIGNTSAVSIAGAATFNTAGSSETVGSIAGAGNLALGSGTTNLTVGGNNTSTSFTGVISGGANANLIKTGTGTLTMSGPNTFDGNLQLNQGTVALGAANVFDNDTSLLLNGGTFATYSAGTGYSDTFNDLSLLANSALDYGSLAGVLDFGSANRAAGTLTIYGWAGDISGGGASQLIFSSDPTGFTGSLSQIVFDGYGAGATRLASGEIVPLTGTVFTWNASGTIWNNNGYWDSTPDGTPNATGHTAIFGSAITSNLTLSLGANRTLGYLVFNDDNNVTLQNNTLRLNVTAGSAQINVNNTGSATINSAVALNDALSINQNSTGTLTIAGNITNQSGTNTVTVGGAGNTTLSGVLGTGAGGLNKTGTGTLTLAGANTFTGAINVDHGVLSISNKNQLGATGATTDLTLNGGTLRVAGADVTVNVGDSGRTIVLGAAGGTFDTVNNFTWDRDITGSGSLTKTGAGTFTFLDPTSFTGAFNINQGTVVFDGGDNRLNDAVAVTIAGGATLNVNTRSDTIGSLAGAGTLTNAGGSAATITFGGTNADTTFSGSITDAAGALNLVKQGDGRTVFSGTNTYDGTTQVDAGTLRIQSASGLGSTAAGTTVASGASLELDHATGISIGSETLSLAGTGVGNGGALRNVSGTNTYAGNVTLTANTEIQSDAGTLTLTGTINGNAASRTLAFDGPGNITATNAIGGNVSTLTKDGTGTLTLSAANTYTGTTTLNAGTTAISNNTALGATGAGTTVNSGATLALAGNITVAENLTTYGQGVGTLGALRSTAGNNTLTGTITLGSETYVGVAAGTTLTATGAVGGTAGLAKHGDGTLILDSAAANTYDGTTAVAAGTLEVRRSTSLGDVNATTIANGATLRLNGSGLSLDENLTVTGTGVAGAGAIQNTGGNNELTGVITMTGNTAVSSTAGTTLTLTDGSLGGAFSLVKTGAGGLTMANTANTYTGTTTLRDGTLTVAAAAPNATNGALGNASSTIQVGDAGTAGGANLALLAGNAAGGIGIDRQISVNNQGSTATLGGTNTSGTNTFSGNIALGRATTLTAAAGGTVAYTGVISGSGPVTSSGTATSNTTLAGANTFSGTVTAASGTLTVTNAAALGSTAAGTTVASGATLALENNISLAAGESLSLAGTGVTGTAGALRNVSGDNTVAGPVTLAGNTTVASAAGTLTMSGAIGQSGGARNLVTEGAGNITLTGTGSFTGSVTVNGTGITTLAAAGGQAFGGVSGITINSGATLALGASNQINDAANLTLAGGTFSTGGFSETMRQLTQTTASNINFLNDGGTLNFNGGGAVSGLGTLTGTLTIDNWAGSLSGNGGEQFVVYSTGGAPVVTGITFTDWGSATTVARGDLGAGFYEIIPILTGTQWNVDSASTQNWATGGNWSPGTAPNGTNAVAILGNTVGSPPLDNNITISMQTTNRTVGKLIFENGADRSYTIGTGTSGRLDFNVSSGQSQIIVNDGGAHTIAASSRYNDNMLVTNNSDAATGLTLSGAISLRNNGTGSNLLTFNGAGRTLVSGAISQSGVTGSLLKTGSGTLVLSGANSYTGTTTLRNGTLELAGNAPSGSSGNLGNATSAIIINDAGTTAGMNTTLLMTDADGGSTVARSLTIGSPGGTTTLGGTNTSGTNTFSGAVTLGKDVSLTATTGGTVAFSGVLSGTGGLDKIGAGTVSLSGNSANTNSGNITVSAGILSLDKNNAGGNGGFADTATVSVASDATLRFNGGTNQTAETIGSLAGAGTVNNTQATALTLTTGGNHANTTFSGVIADSGGNLALVKAGTGTFTLSGGNSYDGDTTVSSGTLVAASNTALGNTSGNTSVAVNATLGLTGNITIAAGEDLALAGSVAPNLASLANLAGSNTYAGAITLTGAAGDDVKVDAAAGTTLTLAGTIGESGGAKDFAKTGTGTVVLGNANTYTGTTNVTAGTLVAASNTALGTTAGATAVQIGATLALQGNVAIAAGEGITLNATASPATASLKNNADNNSIAGTVTLSGGANTGVIINSAAGSSLTLSGAIIPVTPSNNNFVTKTGDGTLVLSGSGANTFQGAFNLHSGTVVANKTPGINATGSGDLNIGDGTGAAASAVLQLNGSHQISNTSNVTIATDGRLNLQGNSDTIGSLTMAGGSVAATGAGTLTLGGNLTFNGIGTNTAAITANVGLGGNRIMQVGNNASTADTDLTITGVISGAGNSLTKTDLGTLRLTGAANTFTGNFQVTDGTVVLDKTAVAGVKGNATGVGNTTVTVGDNFRGANTAILEVSGNGLFAGEVSDQIADTATLVMNSDGQFRMTRSSGTAMFTETVGAIAGSGNIDLGSFGLTAGGNNANTAFSGTLLGDSLSLLTKTGTGTLSIDSNLGFGGNVDLAGGGLAFNVDNAFTGTFNLSAGTTLRLADMVDLSITNLNLIGTGTITLDFSGASSLSVANLNIAEGITLNIINWTDATDYFFAQNWVGAPLDDRGVDPVNQVVFASFTGNDTIWQGYDNQITPVPEPSTYGALLFGALGSLLGWRRWRRRHAA